MNNSGFDALHLNDYLRSGRNHIRGWFGIIDAELFRTLLLSQVNTYHVRGSVAEIGVHQGKSFIALCLALQKDEKAFCIDIFSEQHLNQDQSGRGDRQIFEDNLRRHNIDTDRIVIRQASSFELQGSDVTDVVGPVRFFSIDGGHWLEIVRNDIAIAESCLGEGGIIALDDFHRPEWPDVSAGYFSWSASRSRPIIPFAIGYNKLYLCEEAWRVRYQTALVENSFLRRFLVKTANFQGVDVPVFSEFIFAEKNFVDKQLSLLRISRPNLYNPAKNARSYIKKLLRHIKT